MEFSPKVALAKSRVLEHVSTGCARTISVTAATTAPIVVMLQRATSWTSKRRITSLSCRLQPCDGPNRPRPEAFNIMRNRSPRSFTVETKSGGRHQRTFIPRRAETPVAPRPAVSWPPPAAPQVPAVESRRILPNLIVPESSPDALDQMPAAEELPPKPRRGRPPKAKPIAAELAEQPIAETTDEIAATEPAQVPEMSEPRPVQAMKAPPTLPLGERWKRCLGRWAR